MDLNALLVSDEVIAKDVQLPDGSIQKLFFKELPAVEFRKFFIHEQSENDDVKAKSIAHLIAVSLVTEEGKPAISIKDALRLKASATNAISQAIMEVNGFNLKKD